MFKKILNYFIENSAKEKISKNPLVMAALLRSQHVMKETGLDKIPDQMKEPAQELAEDILTIIIDTTKNLNDISTHKNI